MTTPTSYNPEAMADIYNRLKGTINIPNVQSQSQSSFSNYTSSPQPQQPTQQRNVQVTTTAPAFPTSTTPQQTNWASLIRRVASGVPSASGSTAQGTSSTNAPQGQQSSFGNIVSPLSSSSQNQPQPQSTGQTQPRSNTPQVQTQPNVQVTYNPPSFRQASFRNQTPSRPASSINNPYISNTGVTNNINNNNRNMAQTGSIYSNMSELFDKTISTQNNITGGSLQATQLHNALYNSDITLLDRYYLFLMCKKTTLDLNMVDTLTTNNFQGSAVVRNAPRIKTETDKNIAQFKIALDKLIKLTPNIRLNWGQLIRALEPELVGLIEHSRTVRHKSPQLAYSKGFYMIRDFEESLNEIKIRFECSKVALSVATRMAVSIEPYANGLRSPKIAWGVDAQASRKNNFSALRPENIKDLTDAFEAAILIDPHMLLQCKDYRVEKAQGLRNFENKEHEVLQWKLTYLHEFGKVLQQDFLTPISKITITNHVKSPFMLYFFDVLGYVRFILRRAISHFFATDKFIGRSSRQVVQGSLRDFQYEDVNMLADELYDKIEEVPVAKDEYGDVDTAVFNMISNDPDFLRAIKGMPEQHVQQLIDAIKAEMTKQLLAQTTTNQSNNNNNNNNNNTNNPTAPNQPTGQGTPQSPNVQGGSTDDDDEDTEVIGETQNDS